MAEAFTLYGGAISLYTGKARAYLRYKNVPFIEQPITAEIIKEIGYFMIPVLETPEGKLVQDTTDIIDYLEERFPGPSIYPEDPVQKLCALLLEVYGDEWLVIPAMHYRWNYNRDYILVEFGKNVVPDGSIEEQYQTGEKISAPFSGSLPILGITEDSKPAIETWYEELLGHLNQHLAKREYLFGSRPSIADYGLIGPLYAHNYRDPWSGELMRKLAPNLVRWIDMMNTPAPNGGVFETGIADTLLPIMQRIFRECVPVMVSTCEALATWLDENPDDTPIPRSIGSFTVKIGDATPERNIFPFNQWMFQRPLNYYHSLAGEEKSGVDNFLQSIGGLELMQTQLRYQLTRENYQLQVAHNP